MDGMSEFDWQILSQGMTELKYNKTSIMAMIPTTTSISRQCLLSDKYPVQLIEPWKQTKERQEFVSCAKSLGYNEQQIGYERGYDVDFGNSVKCAAIIINDIDDIVHAQLRGRVGMYNDVKSIAEASKLTELVKKLLLKGFDVYISADHGNTPCTGIGSPRKNGVEIETKSRRMIIVNKIADKESLIKGYGLIDYPKYYLNKEYDYLICNVGESFDIKDKKVISHGGITIDEVIVPFITFKAVENNG